MDGRVGRLHCQYRMTGGSANSFAATSRLDRIARDGELAAACDQLFDKADCGSAVFVVRQLNVPVILNLKARWDDRILAQQWAREIVRGALRQVVRGEDSANYVRFEDQEDLIARFITDLARGEAWNRWFYNCFARLRSLPVADAIESVLLDSRDRLPGVLVRLQTLGGLDVVVGVLNPVVLDRIWALGLNPSTAAPKAELRTFFAAAMRLAIHFRQSEPGLEVSAERLFEEYLATGPISADWRDRSALTLAVVDAFEFLCKRGFLGHPLYPPGNSSDRTEITGVFAQFDWLEVDLLAPAINKLVATYKGFAEAEGPLLETWLNKAAAVAAIQAKYPSIFKQTETPADSQSGDRATGKERKNLDGSPLGPQEASASANRETTPEIRRGATESPIDLQSPPHSQPDEQLTDEAGHTGDAGPVHPEDSVSTNRRSSPDSKDVLALTGETESHKTAAAESRGSFEDVPRTAGSEFNEKPGSVITPARSDAEPEFESATQRAKASEEPPAPTDEQRRAAEAVHGRGETERGLRLVIEAASWIFKGPDYSPTSLEEGELREYLRSNHFRLNAQTNAERTQAVIAALEFLCQRGASQPDLLSMLLGWQESSALSVEFEWLDLGVMAQAANSLAVTRKSQEDEGNQSQTAPLRRPDTVTPRRKRLLTDLAQAAAAERLTMKGGASAMRAIALRLYARLVSNNADWAGDPLTADAIEGLLITASMIDPVAGTYKPGAAGRSGEADRVLETSGRFVQAFGTSGIDLARAVAVASSALPLNPIPQTGVPAAEVWRANYDSECAGVLLLIRAMLDARLTAMALAEGYPLAATILTLGICWCGKPALSQGCVDLALATLAGQDHRATIEELKSTWREVADATHIRFQTRLLALLSARGLLSGEGLEYHRFPLRGGQVAIVAGAINANVWPLIRIANDEQEERTALASLEEAWLTATGISEVARPAGSSSTETLEATLNTVLRECLDGHLDQSLAAWTMAITSVSLLRLWSAWLKQFSGSSTPYLLKNFVRRPGRVRWVEDGILVELVEKPLDIVLEMAGYFASFRAHTNPWQWQVHFRKQS